LPYPKVKAPIPPMSPSRIASATGKKPTLKIHRVQERLGGTGEEEWEIAWDMP
jgi:hypothetical protein